MSTIAELFLTDPFKLTKSDRTEIIKYFREKRTQYHAANLQGPKGKAAKATPVPTDIQAAVKAIDIDVSDLL